jgi:beta-galactosidase
MGRLSYKGTEFYMDEKPYRILSGAIHYFRVVPEYWEDRLKKLKSCGLNTVETYVCWNLHERKEGVFDFDGMLDLERYICIAESLGLNIILRPGPYICTEWDMGGLPSWLLTYRGMRLRCYDALFLDKVKKYLDEVCKRVKSHLSSNGGNIFAIQIENEYGSYGDDKRYLEAVAQIYHDNQMDCLYFTSDGPGNFMLNGGSLPGYLMTLNFGNHPKLNFQYLRKLRPDQPLMCCEYWNGWFDHWFEEHHTRESGDTGEVFEELLEEGASVNFYMFHGGTNFGFHNGANYDGKLQPVVTSYDYNCPITESGDLTPKYFVIKQVVEKYFGKLEEILVENLPKRDYGIIQLNEQADLFDNLDNLSNPVESSYPLTMEELGQDFGFVLYRTKLKGPFEEMELTIDGLHDRAIIYINGERRGVQDRLDRQNDEIKIGLEVGEKAYLDILVENLGRINYGTKIWDEKGILRGVKIGPQYHYGYTIYPLPCEILSQIEYKSSIENKDTKGPVFLRGTFHIEEVADTFVRPDGFTKGNIYINGFNLGRYWNEAGPQKTLYLPAPLLKQGKNEIIAFELESYHCPEIWLTDKVDLG